MLIAAHSDDVASAPPWFEPLCRSMEIFMEILRRQRDA